MATKRTKKPGIASASRKPSKPAKEVLSINGVTAADFDEMLTAASLDETFKNTLRTLFGAAATVAKQGRAKAVATAVLGMTPILAAGIDILGDLVASFRRRADAQAVTVLTDGYVALNLDDDKDAKAVREKLLKVIDAKLDSMPPFGFMLGNVTLSPATPPEAIDPSTPGVAPGLAATLPTEEKKGRKPRRKKEEPAPPPVPAPAASAPEPEELE